MKVVVALRGEDKKREREMKTPMTQPKVAVNLAEGGENKRGGKEVSPNRRLEKRNYLLF